MPTLRAGVYISLTLRHSRADQCGYTGTGKKRERKGLSAVERARAAMYERQNDFVLPTVILERPGNVAEIEEAELRSKVDR